MEYYATQNKNDRVAVFQNKLKQMMIKPNIMATFDRQQKGFDSYKV